MNGQERGSPRRATGGSGQVTDSFYSSRIAPSPTPVNCGAVDTWPDADFAIAGADPLRPFFLSDSAGLGGSLRELVPSRAPTLPRTLEARLRRLEGELARLRQQGARPTAEAPAPAKRIVGGGVEL